MTSLPNFKKEFRKLSPSFIKNEAIFAYLFGSKATGKDTKSSDYDIAIMLKEGLTTNKRFKTRLKLISEISKILKTQNIDIVILNDIQDVIFKFAIVKEGKTIYEKNHIKRVMFEFNVMTNYYDFSPFIDAYNQAYMKKALI